MLTSDNLYSLYRDYNRRFFDSALPAVEIEYSEKLASAAGLFNAEKQQIRLSAPLLSDREQETKDTLLHEMIHVAQSAFNIGERAHGPYFSAQMERINQAARGEASVTVTHHIQEIAAFEENTMLGKIKKLLALSESPNENEAYAAAQKVQALMSAHGVEQADLQTVEVGSELDEPLVNEIIEATGQRVIGWKFSLLGAICRANYCKCLGGGQYGIRALGRKTHVEICRSYYDYFVQVVEREASKHRGKGKIYLNRFREAMVRTIAERLQQQFEQSTQAANASASPSPTSTAALSLASQYNTELETYVRLVYPRINHGRRSSCWADPKATAAGKKAGSKASIAKQIVPANRRLKGDGG
ncbi:SprT-like domain-containing protein [Altericista sp. CCNU0014]|uniref:SprT-like domain-containing protein n=1 Tax=Altericista sp. CCNU0014 TaxID=3082949 RepID=UPI00384DF0F3